MVEQTSKEQEGQQSDSGRTTTQGQGLPQARLGHNHDHRSGRCLIRDAGTGVMSEKELTEQFNRVEKTKADTWAFVVFMVFMATVALLNG